MMFINFYSKLTVVFRSKDYLPHLVTAGIVSPDSVHHLSNMSNRDRAMRVLEYISDSLDGGEKECFYRMLKILEDHGNLHAQNLAEDINKVLVSGMDSVAKINNMRSIARTKSDSIGSITSLRSGSSRSDSMGSTATSTGEGKL